MCVNTLVPDGCLPRIVDTQIDRCLRVFGAMEVAGTKWCAKTWSSLAHGAIVAYVDEGANTSMARADPSLMLGGERPHVIDEWQRAPGIWNAVRHEVDSRRMVRGAFILTGSSTPKPREGGTRTRRRGTARLAGPAASACPQ